MDLPEAHSHSASGMQHAMCCALFTCSTISSSDLLTGKRSARCCNCITTTSSTARQFCCRNTLAYTACNPQGVHRHTQSSANNEYCQALTCCSAHQRH